MTAPHPEPIQLRLDVPDANGSAQTGRERATEVRVSPGLAELLEIDTAPVTQVPVSEPDPREAKRRYEREWRAKWKRRREEGEAERAAETAAERAPAEPERGQPTELQAWVARKRRERDGLPLRKCDREQIREQLEDMGAL